jgi:hypothetical protein
VLLQIFCFPDIKVDEAATITPSLITLNASLLDRTVAASLRGSARGSCVTSLSLLVSELWGEH